MEEALHAADPIDFSLLNPPSRPHTVHLQSIATTTMAITFKPSSLFVTAAALALFVSSPSSMNSVAAQEDNGDIQRINLDDGVVGAVTATDVIGSEASADTVADEAALANTASDNAAPSDAVGGEADVVSSDAVDSDTPAPLDTTSAEETTNEETPASDADPTTNTEDASAQDSVGSEAVVILGGQSTLGAWQDLDLTDSVVSTLVDALSTAANYSPTITQPVCALQINSAQSQLVSGTNYKYQVEGCAINFADELGACRDRECTKAVYEITVYSQTWNDVLQVSSIALTE